MSRDDVWDKKKQFDTFLYQFDSIVEAEAAKENLSGHLNFPGCTDFLKIHGTHQYEFRSIG